MKKLARTVFAVVALSLAGVPSADAQILDWIMKLSGPSFHRVRLGFVWRPSTQGGGWGDGAGIGVAVQGGRSFDEKDSVLVDDPTIYFFGGQFTFEFPEFAFGNNIAVGFGVGASALYFRGEGVSFGHASFIPAQVTIRPTFGSYIVQGLFVVFALHLFTEFEVTDFQPLAISVDRDGFEPVPVFGAGYQIRF